MQKNKSQKRRKVLILNFATCFFLSLDSEEAKRVERRIRSGTDARL
jgi:hypothetical protein